MTIPPMVTDTDMLLSELIKRFKMLSEAARWRDPKEELPEYYKKVEIKIKRDDVVDYVNASLLAEDDGLLFFGDYNFVIFIKLKNVIGWRPIE